MSLNPDFRDALLCFSAERVDDLLVGAYALAAHGLPRATGDIDLWVRASPDNATRIVRALEAFGAHAEPFGADDFTRDDQILLLGIPPVRVDVITSIDGVTFDNAWADRLLVHVDGIPVSIISRRDLLRNTRASGRPQDLADVARLEAQRPTS